jgi:hypothetical protein
VGYTNYLKNKPAFTKAQWALFVSKFKAIMSANSDIVANAFGDEGTSPVITEDRVLFNGIGDDSHETCAISKGATEFDFCKTAHKPYDEVVVDVYRLVREILPKTVLSSDGGPEVFAEIKEPEAPVKEKPVVINNEPAFPHEVVVRGQLNASILYQGMTMRDYFASLATEEDIAFFQERNCSRSLSREKAKYMYADNMLIARSTK